ncbi:retrovirus-related pol polyprotein from transposon TNT 1-94 [Tanacetum coccineum]
MALLKGVIVHWWSSRRSMMIIPKAPCFFWAEAVATACYNQNRSLIHTRHNKTPYEIVHDKKPDLNILQRGAIDIQLRATPSLMENNYRTIRETAISQWLLCSHQSTARNCRRTNSRRTPQSFTNVLHPSHNLVSGDPGLSINHHWECYDSGTQQVNYSRSSQKMDQRIFLGITSWKSLRPVSTR